MKNTRIKKLKKFIRKNWRLLAVVSLAAVFFLGTSSFNYFTQSRDFVKWSSPDEAANYVFARLYAQTGSLVIEEKYNLYAGDIMHPRSYRSDQGCLKPMSFLGLILIYGKIAAFAGDHVLPYLTPFFAGIGLIFFYLLIKKIFGRRNAFVSAFLLAAFPPFVYYSARSMFHNVLFTALLIIGLYCLVLAAEKLSWRGRIFAALAGVCFGLAVITRASELLWILPLLAVIWLFNFRKAGMIKPLLFVSFFVFALLPALYHNQILYGAYYFGGYTEMNRSLADIAVAGNDLVRSTVKGELAFHKDLFGKISDSVFYFGLHPRQSLVMFYRYFIGMFYWIFWPAVLGFVAFALDYRKWKTKHYAYFSALAVTALVLVFYYGSWKFNDNPDAGSYTIGNSYTRYWLPVYLGAMPMAGFFILRLGRVLAGLSAKLPGGADKRRLGGGWRFAAVALIFAISLKFVIFESAESLSATARRHIGAREEMEKILELTESNAAIITLYHDKLLFPERKVIVSLFDDKDMVAHYAELADFLPLYYYNFTLPQNDMDYLNNRRLREAGLAIEKVETITDGFTLYKLYRSE